MPFYTPLKMKFDRLLEIPLTKNYKRTSGLPKLSPTLKKNGRIQTKDS